MFGYKFAFSLFFFLFLASAAVIDQVSSEQLLYIIHGFYQLHFSIIFLLKMGPTILFTHLKIILSQCFSVFSFNFQFSAVSKRTLRRKKRMEARIVILIRKALLQSSMLKLKVISNVLINCIFNACMLNPIRIFYSWISSIHVCSTCLILQQLDWCRFDVRDNSW